MPLINCQHCNRSYSDIKDSCPFCGHNPKEEALRREIIKQTVQLQTAQINIPPSFPRKNQAIAAALAFFFWWIGADVFYTHGFGGGVAYLLTVYIIIPTICFCIPLAFDANPLAWGVILILASQGLIFLFSVIKALYYLSMNADKFHKKYR